MAETAINLAWRLVIMSLIGTGALGVFGLLYRGILALLAASIPQCAGALMGGVLSALLVWWLCKHRNDLICTYPAR